MRVLQRPSSYSGAIFSVVCVFWIFYLLRVFYDHAFTDNSGHQGDILFFALGGCLLPFLAFWRSGLSIANGTYQRVGINYGLLSLCIIIFTYRDYLLNAVGRLGLTGADALNPLQVAYLSSGVFVIALDFVIAPRDYRGGGVVQLGAAYAALGLSVIGLALGASKGAFVAVAVCIFIKFAVFLLKGSFLKGGSVALIIFSALLYGVDAFDFLGSSIVERFKDSGSQDARIDLLVAAYEAFSIKPLWGAGGILPGGGFSHNILAEAFLTTGIFGGLLFLFLNVTVCAKTLYLIYSDPKNAWIGYLFINYLIAALFSGRLHLVPQYWILFAILLLSSRVKMQRPPALAIT